MNKAGFFLIALMLAALPASAKRDVHAELDKKKAIHEKLVEKSKQIGSEVEGLKSKLVNSSKSLRQTEDSLAVTEKKLDGLRKKHAEYVERFYQSQESLGGLVSGAQRFKRTSTSQMLLQSEPLDAARTSLIMKSAIPAMQARTESVRLQLAEIEKIETAITGQVKNKEQEAKKINAQQKDLQSLLEKRQEIYKKTESDRKAQEAEVKKLAAEAKNLDDLVLKIKAKNKPAGKVASRPLPDNMVLPVSGNVVTGFNEATDLGARSKGITFETRLGAAVITPLAGVVKFAGPFQKYRQILIVEHQGGYHSLIAGLGQVDTVVGASLAAGEPVGRAPSTNAPQVYYELRQNGDPVNPQKMLAAQRKQGKT